MTTVLDTGPLVALFDRRDQHHAWAAEALRGLTPPVATCEAVVAEAFHLLGKVSGGPQQLSELLRSGRLIFPFALEAHRARVLDLMETYSDVPMDFADACLVCMLEQDEGRIVTLDSDFSIYRLHSADPLRVLAPWQ